MNINMNINVYIYTHMYTYVYTQWKHIPIFVDSNIRMTIGERSSERLLESGMKPHIWDHTLGM